MNSTWESTPLSSVLVPTSRAEVLDPEKEYHLLGIRLDGGGPFHRETKLGSQIAATTLFRVRTDDFIYSRLFAWRGAFGVIKTNLDGCYVSSEFPTFRVIQEKMDAEFLRLWFRLPGTLARVEEDCTGSTPLTRNRFKEQFFLAMEIPLPSLDEQRRIVARIDALAARIEEARGLRREAGEEAERLMAAEEINIWPDEKLEGAALLEEVTEYLSRGRQSTQGESEHYLIKTQHVQMGKYVRTHLTLAPEVASKVSPEALARQGDILIACSAAGCLGRVACYTDSDRITSTDTHVAIARAKSQIIMPEYLYAYLKGFQGQKQLRSREQGDWTKEKVGFRLAELNLADLKQVPVPLPPLDEQRRIVAYLDELQTKADALKRLQAEAAAELEALLPAVLDQAFRGEL